MTRLRWRAMYGEFTKHFWAASPELAKWTTLCGRTEPTWRIKVRAYRGEAKCSECQRLKETFR
jgi:hypothetical protein